VFTHDTLECTRTDPQEVQHKDGSFWYVDGKDGCVEALVKAGVIKRGECMRSGASGCLSQSVRATDKSGFSTPANGLVFPCGKQALTGINSITTEGNKATVKYERQVTLDRSIAEAAAYGCTIKTPDLGAQMSTRTLSKDDDGNWSINK
jgi:hypothetical protein